MKAKITGMVIVLVVASAVLGASAFTSGSVERNSNVNVVSDDKGLIGLSDGTSGPLVYQNSTGALEIDFTNGTAQGANVDGHFELGNKNDANQSAFNVTNNDDESHSMTLNYTPNSDDSDGTANLEFLVYDGSGTKVATATEESSASFTAAAGETFNVVIVVDTHGLTTSDDLSGTLKVSV